MKHAATVIGALILATGAAQASYLTDTSRHIDIPTAPVTAQNPVQVKAADVMSDPELARSGTDADADRTVSDFTAPGPRSTYTR